MKIKAIVLAVLFLVCGLIQNAFAVASEEETILASLFSDVSDLYGCSVKSFELISSSDNVDHYKLVAKCPGNENDVIETVEVENSASLENEKGSIMGSNLTAKKPAERICRAKKTVCKKVAGTFICYRRCVIWQ